MKMRFVLTEDAANRAVVGMDQGVYSMRVSRLHEGWEMSLMDCIGYCAARKIELQLDVSAEELNQARAAYAGHCYDERALRPDEPRVLVHSTTPEGLRGILASGALLSWNALRAQGMLDEDAPIGCALGDPEEFRDYCMLGGSAHWGEIVSCARAHCSLDVGEHTPYIPGGRLYFDAGAIARDGLLIRDGQHLKVRECLPLDQYLLLCVDNAEGKEYTPLTFTDYANGLFREKYPHLPL